MKSTRRSMLIQSGLLALVLLVLAYWVWQGNRSPAPRTYEGKTLDQWLEDLDDPDYHVSERAADVLVNVGADAVPLLLDACEQGGPRLHRRAAAVLVRLGASAARGLATALKDKAQPQRVAVALVRLGPVAVGPLREALLEEKGGEAAAYILGLIGPRAADAVPDLIAAVQRASSSTALRGQAVFALGRIGEPSEAIVPALITALKDSKKEVREQAVIALGWIGSPTHEVVSALTAALNDKETIIAIKVCRVLSLLGSSEATPDLLTVLQSDRHEVAVEAGRALWRLGPKAAPIVPMLLSAAQGPIDKAAPARDLLASFGPDVVPDLVKQLRANEAARREAAADVLGRIGPPARAAVPDLLAALKDQSSSVALMAAMALAQIDSTRGGAAVKLLTDALDVPGAALALANIGPSARAAVPDLIAALKPRKQTAQDELIRLNARLALSRIGAPAVPALIDALKAKREGVAPLAGGALGWILPPPKVAISALRIAIKNDRAHAAVYANSLGQLGPLALPAVPELTDLLTDAATRPEAAVALVGIDPEQSKTVVPQLVKDLQGDDEKQRQAAVLAVARIGPAAQAAAEALTDLLRDRLLTEREIIALQANWARALPGLIDLLKDPEVERRKLAIFALAQTGTAAQAALEPLIAALSDRDDEVRAEAAHVLEQIGSEAAEAVPALIANLQVPQTRVRYTAAEALRAIGAAAKEARRPLLECLFDPDEHVRYAAALALGGIDPAFTEAMPALRDALNDPSPLVRLAAIDSLIHIDRTNCMDSVPLLITLSAKPDDLRVRFRAVEGLYELAPDQAKQAVPWLLVEMTVVDAEFNFLYAARVLARIDSSQASRVILALASALRPVDLVGSRRRAILRTLGQFGPKARDVVPEIEFMLYDSTPGVRSEAIQALRAIHPARVKQLGLD
ncbi:MAG TPA: HEAT repeat domain-containing protein [Gemmataceae bacterium]|jgi:HEAT repeat protein